MPLYIRRGTCRAKRQYGLYKYSLCNINRSPKYYFKVNSFIHYIQESFLLHTASHMIWIFRLRPSHHARCLHWVLNVIYFIQLVKIKDFKVSQLPICVSLMWSYLFAISVMPKRLDADMGVEPSSHSGYEPKLGTGPSAI